MPFKSKAQVRKFYALKRQGKMDQATIDQWMSETKTSIKKLPERLKKTAFWGGFEKQAGKMKELWAEMQEVKLADILTGGSGFTGEGKGQLAGQLEAPVKDGPVSRSSPGGDDTKVDKTLLDRERNPRDYSPFSLGEEFTVESNQHIKY